MGKAMLAPRLSSLATPMAAAWKASPERVASGARPLPPRTFALLSRLRSRPPDDAGLGSRRGPTLSGARHHHEDDKHGSRKPRLDGRRPDARGADGAGRGGAGGAERRAHLEPERPSRRRPLRSAARVLRPPAAAGLLPEREDGD